jgi:glycosyltransferase involved in cell wall biosynthesis
MALHLARGLRDAGHEVVPICIPGGEGFLSGGFAELGFEPEWFGLNRPVEWAAVGRLREILRRRGVDVLHAHDFSMGVYGAAACRIERVPYVITLHGGGYFAAKGRRRVAFRWAVRGSRATVGVSETTRREAVELLGLKYDAVGMIPNGLRFEAGDPNRVRVGLGLGEGIPFLLAVGNLYPVKGHVVLVEALAELAQRRPELEWRAGIAGRGDQEQILAERIRETGLEGRVQLLGFRRDVPDLLAAADVYVMPSLSEGLPLALVEAMFSETAVVASAVGGIPEVVEDGVSALLVPPQDPPALAVALERLLTEVGERDALARAGRATAEARFSLGTMIEAYRAAYTG